MGSYPSYNEEELAELRRQRNALVEGIHTIPRKVSLRDLFVLTTLCALSFQLIRWTQVPLKLAGHVYGLLLVVFVCETFVFRASRRVAAMCFGGGMYAITLVMFYLERADWGPILLTAWQFVYGLGCIAGLGAGATIHVVLSLLQFMDSISGISSRTEASENALNPTPSLDSESVITERMYPPTRCDSLSIDWNWLRSFSTVGTVVMFIWGGTSFVDYHPLRSYILIHVWFGVAWLLFGVRVLCPPFLSTNEFDRGIEVAKRGGTLLVVPSFLLGAFLVAATIFFRGSISSEPLDHIIAMVLWGIVLTMLITSCGFALGLVSATILHGFVPELCLFAKRVIARLKRTSPTADQT